LGNWEIALINFSILFSNFLIHLFLFDFAVLLAAVNIAVSSRASLSNGSTAILSALFVSGIMPNQNVDSSASFSTMPILAMNSL